MHFFLSPTVSSRGSQRQRRQVGPPKKNTKPKKAEENLALTAYSTPALPQHYGRLRVPPVSVRSEWVGSVWAVGWPGPVSLLRGPP